MNNSSRFPEAFRRAISWVMAHPGHSVEPYRFRETAEYRICDAVGNVIDHESYDPLPYDESGNSEDKARAISALLDRH
jgi:hypothetical protein